MAKETAHQLGTPTSSLMANLELLKIKKNDETIVGEIEKDVRRLEKITERFSKIGSNPKLKEENIIPILLNAIHYIRSRTSKKISYSLNFDTNETILVPINKALFEWVIENLVKNAIDSMNGTGEMKLQLNKKNNHLAIDVIDNGKGIPKTRHKTIFQPGYTTKKRGWGLGLSLAKRIIEVYHKGRIFVQQSELKKGTTMRIVLRKNQ
jgi:signal transduction histidine kinase